MISTYTLHCARFVLEFTRDRDSILNNTLSLRTNIPILTAFIVQSVQNNKNIIFYVSFTHTMFLPPAMRVIINYKFIIDHKDVDVQCDKYLPSIL